jgi:hypothetical protein
MEGKYREIYTSDHNILRVQTYIHSEITYGLRGKIVFLSHRSQDNSVGVLNRPKRCTNSDLFSGSSKKLPVL